MEEQNNLNIDHDVDNIIKEAKKFRFQIELSQTNNSEKKEIIQKIINNIENIQEANDPNKNKNILSDFTNNVYHQPWTKLKVFHKEDRINKFVDDKFKNDPNKDEILQLLIDKCKDGYLNKKEVVNYDTVTGKIIEIPLLKIVEGKYELHINKPKTKKIKST
jgi:hypothetical protein